MDVLLVSHFHWDREWYRTFDEFRARLVDAIDAVLDLVAADDGFRFVLDGQSIVLEDYLEVRPHRADELRAGLAAGRLSAGPWYVQPDSLLPGAETHVRNLLHGRAVAGAYGPVSRVAYVPDSFGHPARFPQLFAGFGLDPFVYWRGNGSELDRLGPLYRWRAPDGSSVRAWHLGEGYFGAGALDADGDVEVTATRLEAVVKRLAGAGAGPVLLMNGFDHLPADATTGGVAAALAEHTGAHVRRGLLDDAIELLPDAATLPEHSGALIGGRVTNQLPGVWSSRMPLKRRNRVVETLLTGWAEPWVAFGTALGLADERPSLTRAWRTLLCNQAHDSIGGCSVDAVHERMAARYDDAEGLGNATVTRVLERLAGRDLTRSSPWTSAQQVTVFNPSPHARSGLVRTQLEGFPPWRASVGRFDMHPLVMPDFRGVTVDGAPARLFASENPARVRFLPSVGGLDLEFMAHDIPAFGCRTFRVEPAAPTPDTVDDGTVIAAGDVRVEAEPGGTLAVTLGERTWRGLFALEDAIDRGDTYDADTDPPAALPAPVVTVTRTRHVSGIERLVVHRQVEGLGSVRVETAVAPGLRALTCRVTLDNQARDHRLRLVFPTGAPAASYDLATTFGHDRRDFTEVDTTGWVHPAPRTFVHQGWIAANGLVVGAPGLPEGEVTPGGDIHVTLIRSVGSIAKLELRTRPVPAAPEMPAPGAQVQGVLDASITIATSVRDANDAELGLRGVLAGPSPMLAAGHSLLQLTAERCELSACKPAEDGDGIVVRLLNPSATDETVELRTGIALTSATPVRLDETPAGDALAIDDDRLVATVPAYATRSFRLRYALRR